MRAVSLVFGIFASRTLAAAVPPPELYEADASPAELDDNDSIIFLSAAYLVPADIPVEDYNENAPFMKLAGYDSLDTNGTEVEIDYPEDIISEHRRDGSEVSWSSPLLEARQFSGTRFYVGKTHTDYGCEGSIASVRSILGDAVFSLCQGGDCDYGTVWSRKISHLNNGEFRKDRWVQVRARGRYNGDSTRGAMRDGVRNLVQSKSIAYADRRRVPGPSGVGAYCKMAKFSNYLKIWKPQGTVKIDVEVEIKLNDVNANCLAWDILSAIAGSMNGVAGGLFAGASLLCNS